MNGEDLDDIISSYLLEEGIDANDLSLFDDSAVDWENRIDKANSSSNSADDVKPKINADPSPLSKVGCREIIAWSMYDVSPFFFTLSLTFL